MKLLSKILFIALLFGSYLSFSNSVRAADFTVEYDTAKAYEVNYGYQPQVALISYNSMLYGVSRYGGEYNLGTVYSINPTTWALTLLHSFQSANGMGYNPVASLTEVGGKLYGVAYKGGQYDKGVVYVLNTDGTGYTVLKSFEGGAGDGSTPYSPLLIDSNVIYGATIAGGTNNSGTVFKLNTDGTGYSVLHNFNGTLGGSPYAGLLLHNNVLYGAAHAGGTSNCGLLYSIDPDGTNFQVRHNFTCGGVPDEGQSPYYRLIVYNNKLYGVAGGGAAYKGIMFSINPDGTGYTKLISFSTITEPTSSIIEKDGIFYLVSNSGGANNAGAVFSINPDGTNLVLLHSFLADGSEGYSAMGLLLSGTTLYGTTYGGGTTGDGAIYSMEANGSAFAIRHNYVQSYLSELQTGLVPYNNKLYGTSVYGGSDDAGTIYSFDPATKQVQLLHSFDSAEGTTPYAAPVLVGSRFYGSLSSDGAGGDGSIYGIDADGTDFQILHAFEGGVTDGVWPMSQLIEVAGVLYGTAYFGGTDDKGIIFSISTDGTDFTVRHSFTGTVSDGMNPYSGMTLVSGKLYGTTRYGGANNNGTIFSIDPDGSNFAILHSFNSGADDAGAPQVELVYSNNKLYGTTEYGGSEGLGSLFSINLDGTGYQILFNFDAGNLSYPEGSVFPYNGKLYGVAGGSSIEGNGGLYSVNPDGSSFTMLHEFLYDTEGGYPYFHVTPTYHDKKLYSVNTYGGVVGNGTIYSYKLPDIYPPEIELLAPASDSVLTGSTPTVTLTLDENGTCRASYTDLDFDDMTADLVCTGGGTTSNVCTLPHSVTPKTVYFSCTDTLDNKDTIDSNTAANYTWAPLPTPTPTAVSTPITTPTSTPTPTEIVEEPEEKIVLNDYSEYLLGEGKLFDLKSKQAVYFLVNNNGTQEEHSATVTEVGEDYVIVTIASSPTLVRLALGEEKLHDVTGDGKMDVSIRLNAITKGIANLTFSQVLSPTVTPTATTTASVTTTQQKKSTSSLWLLLLIPTAMMVFLLLRKKA